MRRKIDPNAKQQRIAVRLRLVLIEVAQARKMKPPKIARYSGLTVGAVRFVFNNDNSFRVDTLDRFAIAFRTYASELFAIAEWREGYHSRPPELARELHLAGADRARGRKSRRPPKDGSGSGGVVKR